MFFIKKERGFIMSSIDSAIDLNAGSVSENVKTTLRGELVLAFAVIINSKLTIYDFHHFLFCHFITHLLEK